jgi:hypothetical protein
LVLLAIREPGIAQAGADRHDSPALDVLHVWHFAETWAYYLHIVDTLEIMRAFGQSTQPRLAKGEEPDATVDFDPYRASGIGQFIDSWTLLPLVLNSLNRAIGQPDVYSSVLLPRVIEKLGFIHRLVHPTR